MGAGAATASKESVDEAANMIQRVERERQRKAAASEPKATLHLPVPPAPHPAAILEAVVLRIKGLETEGSVTADSASALQKKAARAVELCPAEPDIVTEDAVVAIRMLSEQCLAVAVEAGLTAAAAELLCEGLAATAVLVSRSETRSSAVPLLESVCGALDGFAMEIFALLWRLDQIVQPQWSLRGVGLGGSVAFAANTGPFQKYSGDLRRYQTLQGVCIWALALVVRAIGYSQFTAASLWEFCSGDPLCAIILAKGALCFFQSTSETSLVRVPHDLPDLRDAVLGALLSLPSQDLAFINFTGTGDIDIRERNLTLMRHHALLAATSADNGILDCLLACQWACTTSSVAHSRIPALTSFVSALVCSEAVEECLPQEAEDIKAWTTHVTGKCAEIWGIILLFKEHKKSFVRDCAKLAFFVPPPDTTSSTLIQQCLVDSETRLLDPGCLAALVAFAANCGRKPVGSCSLTDAIMALNSERKSEVFACLQSLSEVRAEALALWREFVIQCAEEASPPVASQTAVASNTPSAALKPWTGPQAVGLRDLIAGVPPNFRCALDGKLLVDPVRSPSGHVFERCVLARALEANDGQCPMTNTPLTLHECPREPQLRVLITKWVRTNRPKCQAH